MGNVLKKLLVNLFNVFDRENLEYCVCGNYANLPDFTLHDVDIWVESLSAGENILNSVAEKLCLQKYLSYETGSSSNNLFYYKHLSCDIEIVKIDLMTFCAWRSIFPLVSRDILLQNRRVYKGFYVPLRYVEANMQLLYPLLTLRKVKDKYKDLIFESYDKQEFKELLNIALGSKYASELIAKIKNKRWKQIEDSATKLRFRCISRFISNISINSIMLAVRSLLLLAKKYIFPKGIFVAFIGIDGCGKTTICEKTTEALEKAFIKKKPIIFYWRPMLLPPIRNLLKKIFFNKFSSISNEQKLNGFYSTYLVSFIKFIYYCTDYILGLFKYYPFIAKGGFICFDRYYYDFFVYPERFGLKLPRWIVSVMKYLVVKPNLIFYLSAPASIIVARKNEVSLKEIERRDLEYKKICQTIGNVHKIDTSLPIRNVIKSISLIILKSLARRS